MVAQRRQVLTRQQKVVVGVQLPELAVQYIEMLVAKVFIHQVDVLLHVNLPINDGKIGEVSEPSVHKFARIPGCLVWCLTCKKA